jgi:hypothetical protein
LSKKEHEASADMEQKTAGEHERLKREKAEKRAEARRESDDRQETIKVLSKECEGLPKRRDFNELLDELEKLADTYGSSLSDRLRSLHQLAELQDREIEYLTQFRRDWERIQAYYSEQLETLNTQSLFAQFRRHADTLLAPEEPKKEWERKRGGYRRIRAGVGLIEYEFGGDGEAKWRKSSLSGLPYQPSCLDDILRGSVGEVKMQPSFRGPPIAIDTVTNMRRLQILFGIHRDRFPKELRGRSMGKMIVYDWRDVVKIMGALLSEPRKRSLRGRPRTLWLSDPDLRTRVLSGIEARINSISAPKEIVTACLDLVRHHRVDSAKK